MDTHHYHIVHYRYESRCADSRLISIDELACLARVHQDMIQNMVSWSLLEPFKFDPEPLFYETAVPQVWRIMRLHKDLGINWNGIGVVMDLLKKIDNLEHEIDRLNTVPSGSTET